MIGSNNPRQVPLPSTLVESNEVIAMDLEGMTLSDEDDASPFETYYDDQAQTDPKQKIALIIMYSMTGIVDGFCLSSLHKSPYKEQNIHHIKPKIISIKEEIKRLNPSASCLSAATLGELLQILGSTHATIFTDECRTFIAKKHEEM